MSGIVAGERRERLTALKAGWTVERALTAPPQVYRRSEPALPGGAP